MRVPCGASAATATSTHSASVTRTNSRSISIAASRSTDACGRRLCGAWMRGCVRMQMQKGHGHCATHIGAKGPSGAGEARRAGGGSGRGGVSQGEYD